MKKLSFIQRSNGAHCVGDGFPVRNIFSYNDIAEEVSPFLLLDYAGPTLFEPTHRQRGVGAHPHRGFETVTLVYEGQVEHRDSSGAGGIIGPGDVQWMTAASGVVHEEFHGADFAKNGGKFEVVQLWVNLPAKNKSAAPAYQGIKKSEIPTVFLPEGSGSMRVIAGEFDSNRGPAHTFSPVNLWEASVTGGSTVNMQIPQGYTTCVFLLRGRIRLPSGESLKAAELAVFNREGTTLSLNVIEDATFIILSGEPLNEPIVARGPFVMNTPAEIKQAFQDYEDGRMGTRYQSLR